MYYEVVWIVWLHMYVPSPDTHLYFECTLHQDIGKCPPFAVITRVLSWGVPQQHLPEFNVGSGLHLLVHTHVSWPHRWKQWCASAVTVALCVLARGLCLLTYYFSWQNVAGQLLSAWTIFFFCLSFICYYYAVSDDEFGGIIVDVIIVMHCYSPASV